MSARVVRHLRHAVVAVLIVCTLPSCRSREDVLRIGAKDFAEQRVMAQMLAVLARDRGIDARVVNCGDTFGCQNALSRGDLDLMVDYTGTGLVFAGSPPPDRDRPVEQVDALYRPRGIHWSHPLGFNNAYRVLVRAGVAAGAELKSIGDLRQLPGGVRLAVPAEFERRPGDGLAGLLRHYGLELASPVQAIDDPASRYRALAEGRVDAVIGYATDGELVGLRLVTLADDEAFFPPYHAAVVARKGVLAHHAAFAEALAGLTGRIDAAAMRQMNYAATVEARNPADVARAKLTELGLASETAASTATEKPLGIVLNPGDGVGPMAARAAMASRRVFEGRSVRVEHSGDPIGRLVSGGVRLAVLGTERFFSPDGKRDERLRAVAVLGTRYVHLLRRRGDASGGLGGRIGAPPAGSATGRIADVVLAQLGLRPARRAPVQELLKLVGSELDAVLYPAATGDPYVAAALAAETVELSPLVGWVTPTSANQVPWLRQARLPPRTYLGQEKGVDTLASQVLLANAVTTSGAIAAEGPAGPLPAPSVALTRKQALALADAVGIREAPDPVIPVAWGSEPPPPTDSLRHQVVDTTLNGLALLFLAWLIVQSTRPLTAAERPRMAAAPEKDAE